MPFHLISPFISIGSFLLVIGYLAYKKNNKKAQLAFPLFGLFFLVIFYSFYKNYKETKNFEFEGKIANITYSEKKIPSIFVNGKVYTLSYKREFKDMVHIGDWAVKHKGQMKVKFIAQSTKKICYIELF